MTPQEIFDAMMNQKQVMYNNDKYTVHSMDMDYVALYDAEKDNIIYDIIFKQVKEQLK